MKQTDSAETLIEQLGLTAHPEGGWYKETWRGAPGSTGRASGTAIVFLLKNDERSHWHRVDADEMWLWQAGDPLALMLADDDTGPVRTITLGCDVGAGQELQGLVPTSAWQAAEPSPSSSGAMGYSLVSCVVMPGFDFAGFELAPPGWAPGSGAYK